MSYDDPRDFADEIDFEDFGRFVYEYLGFDDYVYWHTEDNYKSKALGNEESKEAFRKYDEEKIKYRKDYYKEMHEIKKLKKLLEKVEEMNESNN